MNLEKMSIKELVDLVSIFENKLKSVESNAPEKTKDNAQSSLGKNICVLQRGWVLVGDLFKNGSEYTLENASVVRIWGTSKGLGELAEDGPLSSTKLDPCPATTFHELTVVLFMKCSNKWK